jgi:hypothetical protein
VGEGQLILVAELASLIIRLRHDGDIWVGRARTLPPARSQEWAVRVIGASCGPRPPN